MSLPNAPELLAAEREGDVLKVRFAGKWSVREDPPDFASLEPQLGGGAPLSAVSFDADGLSNFDSSLVSFLLELHRRCELTGVTFGRETLPKEVDDLLEMALAVPEKKDANEGVEEVSFIYRIGSASLALVDGVFDLVRFIGECILAFGRFVSGRARFRRRDLWMIIQECGAEALPIVTLINLLIGMILAFVGAVQLETMGAKIFIANLVAVAMVREMGAIMTGIIMSGRTGAAFAAQIGSMKINQEIDALRTFGFSPIDFLVMPRMIALIIMMPLLTIYANLVGILGGLFVGLATGLSFEQYFAQTLRALDLTTCSIGIGKSIVFGVIIAAAGCLRGMQSGNSSSAVGTAATNAVVTAITAIIIADAFFAVVTTIAGI